MLSKKLSIPYFKEMNTNMIIPAILVITYNRPDSLKRLLTSLSHAQYLDQTSVNLIISIDFQDSKQHQDVLEIARSYDWPFGEKRIIEHQANLGLRSHVLRCGDLSREYEAIIMLEDDLVVSRFFYLYAVKALTQYDEDAAVAGISLYNHKTNFCNRLPFELIGEISSDVYFMQIASSWGQAWTKKQWTGFRNWYDEGQKVNQDDVLPQAVLDWPESSWLKYFIKYLVVTDKYFVYPKVSFSTNFGDSGTHNPESDTSFQVPLVCSGIDYMRFPKMEDSINVYDSFFEPDEAILKRLNPELINKEFVVDLYGLKNLGRFNQAYALSNKMLLGEPIYSFGLSLKPMAANVFNGVNGDYFHFAGKELFLDKNAGQNISNVTWTYFFGKADFKRLSFVLKEKIIKRVKHF